ncbi:DUF2075 domain-containing protein [Tenacibaculum dicentrarchi]|nr:DUF2075 domain-containing protein [Tenacibaculum dicentrarchi]
MSPFSTPTNITSYPFNKNQIQYIKQDEFANSNYPIVYIIYNDTTKIAYVGESTNAINRMSNHLTHSEKSKLKFVYIISSITFNKSATLDIESYLIQYLTASGDFKLLNGNGGISSHNYYQKEKYFEIFKDIWSKLEFSNVKMKNLLELQNSNLFKYSPYKSLSEDQFSSILEILDGYASKKYNSIFVNGSAGTGKTILAIYLIKLMVMVSNNDLEDLDIEDENLLNKLIALKNIFPEGLIVGLVIPMSSLRSTLKKVFQSIHGLNQNMVIGPNDVIKKKYDLLITDEAHRLTRRKGIMGYGAFDNVNRKLDLYHSEVINGKNIQSAEKNGTQLDWIIKSSTYHLFFYDSEQSIKPADIRKEDFDKIKELKNSKEIHLISQMRSQGGTDYIEFINNLMYSKIPKKSIFKNSDYDLLLFTNMKEMITKLQKKEDEFGLCRTISGYSWKWVSRNENLPDTIIDGVELTWNKTNIDFINSTNDVTEMGCIHTTQGYDLNYSAIIFGEEIDYCPINNEIIILRENYHDRNGAQGITNPKELQEYIIKIYKTIMFRGIRGTYVYACNKNLREYFMKHISLNCNTL